MNKNDLKVNSNQKELDFAKSLAREAGKMMRDAFGLHPKKTWKSDHSPITDADLSINKYVIARVQESFPDDGVLGEEISFEPSRKRLWVVDPIDGTYAFTIGAPLSTFSLGLVIDGEPVLGVVYDPFMDRMFWAECGKGAFVNDEPLHVSEAKKLSNEYITLSSRHMEGGKMTGELFDSVEREGGKAFSFRSFVYSGCLVAAGTAVAAVIGTPKPWDLAALLVILEEAGGKATGLDGKPHSYKSKDALIATNGLVHERILELVNE